LESRTVLFQGILFLEKNKIKDKWVPGKKKIEELAYTAED